MFVRELGTDAAAFYEETHWTAIIKMNSFCLVWLKKKPQNKKQTTNNKKTNSLP